MKVKAPAGRFCGVLETAALLNLDALAHVAVWEHTTYRQLI